MLPNAGNRVKRQSSNPSQIEGAGSGALRTEYRHVSSRGQSLSKTSAHQKALTSQGDPFDVCDSSNENETDSRSDTVQIISDPATESPAVKVVAASRVCPTTSDKYDDTKTTSVLSSDSDPRTSVPPHQLASVPNSNASLHRSYTLPSPPQSVSKQIPGPFQPTSRKIVKFELTPTHPAIANPNEVHPPSKKNLSADILNRPTTSNAVSMPNPFPISSQKQLPLARSYSKTPTHYSEPKSKFVVPTLKNRITTAERDPEAILISSSLNINSVGRDQGATVRPEMASKPKPVTNMPSVSQRHPPPTTDLPCVPRRMNTTHVNQSACSSHHDYQSVSHSTTQVMGSRRIVMGSHSRSAGGAPVSNRHGRSEAPVTRHVTADSSVIFAKGDQPQKRPRAQHRQSAPLYDERMPNFSAVEDIDDDRVEAVPVQKLSLRATPTKAAAAAAIAAVRTAAGETKTKPSPDSGNDNNAIIISSKPCLANGASNRVNESHIDADAEMNVDVPEAGNKSKSSTTVLREHVNLADEDEGNSSENDLENNENFRVKRQKQETWQNINADKEQCRKILLEALRDRPNILSFPFLGMHESDLRNLFELDEAVKAAEDSNTCDRLICLNNNRINQLTNHVCRLFAKLQVTELELSSNSLSEIPDCLAVCKNLRMLNLAHNGLTELPKGITKLEHLEILNVSYNLLVTLPNEMCKLQELEILSVAHNRLLRLPVDMTCENSKLFALDVSGNKPLVTLPPCLEKCSKIRYLEFSHTSFYSHLSNKERGLKPLSLIKLVGGFETPEFIFRDAYGDYPNGDEPVTALETGPNSTKEGDNNDGNIET